jgi:hypothetical protein
MITVQCVRVKNEYSSVCTCEKYSPVCTCLDLDMIRQIITEFCHLVNWSTLYCDFMILVFNALLSFCILYLDFNIYCNGLVMFVTY